MAEQQVSTALNRLSDEAFTASLSNRDRESLAALVEEYFCASASTNESEDEDEEEFGDHGMQ